MSINHYSVDLQETKLWWPQQQLMEPNQNLPDPLRLNLNHQNDDDDDDNDDEYDTNQSITTTAVIATTTTEQEEPEDEKEPMFEKPLTPSDVGKLNRLVIPKQHAEKYFPLSSGGDSGECKGLLLSFEDESGKCWRFRYSYWNSSQSYVLTKGWSRYVKDKRLDAGDVVLFERHRVDTQRFFIGWRRRIQSDAVTHVSNRKSSGGDGNGKSEVVGGGGGGGGGGVGVGWTRGFYSAHPYPTHHQTLPYQHDCLHAGRGSQGQKQRTRAVGNSASSSSSSRVLRLFGVNMECQPEHDSGPSTPQCSYNSSNMPSTQGTHTHHHHFYHHDDDHDDDHHQQQRQPSNSNPPPHHMVRHQPYYY